jgi:ribosome-binding factor A
MSRRMERIDQQLRSEIARVLREEATDPRIHMVTLTRVDCAPDLSVALVFWSSIEADDEDSLRRIEAGLASAATFVRHRIAQVLPLRRTPRLEFRFDPSLEQGARTLSLLRELSDGEKA